MVSAVLKNSDRVPDERGSGRFNPYASTDPAKNLAYQRVRLMSPDELFSAGYRHGLENAGMRGSMSGSVSYTAGFSEGYKARTAAV